MLSSDEEKCMWPKMRERIKQWESVLGVCEWCTHLCRCETSCMFSLPQICLPSLLAPPLMEID